METPIQVSDQLNTETNVENGLRFGALKIDVCAFGEIILFRFQEQAAQCKVSKLSDT